MNTGWRPVRRFPTAKHIKVRLRQLGTDLSLARRKRAYRRQQGPTGLARACFVVGCQRSGTDMVLWTLDKSMDVDRYDENARAAFCDCRIKDRQTREALVSRSNAKRVIFKPVCDSHKTGELVAGHEDARAVWVYRDYRDVANSAVQRWGEMSLDWVRDLARGGGDWGRRQWNRELMNSERQARIEELCDENLNPHGAAAVFWYLVNESFFDQELAAHPLVTVARYEDLVTSPESQFRRLCEFFGVEYRNEMVRSIFVSSVRKRSKAPISPKISALCEKTMSRLDHALAEKTS
jgi:hypothetical protein